MSRAENRRGGGGGCGGEKILTRERRSETTSSGGASDSLPPPLPHPLPSAPSAHFPIHLLPHVYASMRNASAYQREPEYVAIANGLARLDGPVINCVTHDYITDAADPLYYIQSYVRAARTDCAPLRYVPRAAFARVFAGRRWGRKGDGERVRAFNKSAATGGAGRRGSGVGEGGERGGEGECRDTCETGRGR